MATQILNSDYMKDGFVLFGKITKTHGLKGEFVIESNFSEPYDYYKSFFYNVGNELEKIMLHIKGILNGDRIIMSSNGINSIEEAKKLLSLNIYVKRGDMPELQDGEYYPCDLMGMKVLCEEEVLGIVNDIVDFGSGINFEVKDLQEKLEYYVYDEHTVIDINAKQIQVKKMEYV